LIFTRGLSFLNFLIQNQGLHSFGINIFLYLRFRVF
jgi:hypothetical protein